MHAPEPPLERLQIKGIRFAGKRMDKRRLEFYRKRLLERQQQLFEAVSKTEQDFADKASTSYTKEFLFKKSNDDRFILHLIQEALRRMNDGAFDVCVECGGEMQPKRLEAVPWARHCIECQEKQDQGLLR